MKRRTLAWMLILCAVLFTSCAANTRGAVTPKHPSFSLETDGLVQVQTVHESDQTVKSYSLASGQRIMDAEPFIPDGMRVYTADFLTFGMDNMLKGPLRVYDEEKLEAPVTREIDAICRAMREVGHQVMQCRILQVGDEWFASAMLNVNLWTPYRFYYYHQESGRLMLLYEFNGRDVTAVRVLSADRLHALDQQSIGGWHYFTPDSLMEAHPDVLENTAQMLLRRGDLFDEAAVRGRDHSRKLTVDSFSGLPFGYVLNGVTYGYENVTYLNDNEKAVFQSLPLCGL